MPDLNKTVPLEKRFAKLAVAMVLIAALGFAVTRFWPSNIPAEPSIESLSARKLGYGPRDFAAAIEQADSRVELGRERVARDPISWANQESLGSALMARARLTGDFDDLAKSGAAFASGVKTAPKGSGPQMGRAVHNMMVHRLIAVAPDLAMLSRSAVSLSKDEQAEIEAMRGDLAFYGGNYQAAQTAYVKADNMAADTSITYRMAIWAKAMGDPDSAVTLFSKAARINTAPTAPFIANVMLQAGSVELMRGEWEKASALFDRADKRFPGSWLIAAHRAQMLALKGDFAGAERLYLRSIETSKSPEVIDALAALYRATGDAEASRKWAAVSAGIWARRVATLPEAAYGHALEHELTLGDPKRALDLARKNHFARPFGDSKILLASAMIANNQPQPAIALLDAVSASGWKSAAQFVGLFQAYSMIGEGAKADAARAAALAINPRAFDRNANLIWFGHH